MSDQGTRAWLRPTFTGLSLVVACLGACILPDVDLEGRACPCAAGYTCDVATDTCIEGDATAASSGSTVASSSQGEGPSTTDASSASDSSAGGAGGTGGTGGAGGDGGAPGDGGAGGGGAPATTSSTGSGGAGGEGGSSPCQAGQTTDVPMCSDFFDTFDDPGAFGDNWTRLGSQSAYAVENSRLTITMTTQTALLATADDVFDMTSCGITVRLLTAPTGKGAFGRISIAPQGEQSRFGIGVVEGILQAREGDSVVAATGYDVDVHRYLRIREEAGTLFLGTSTDGVCWDELHEVVSADTAGLTGRLGIVADAATDAFVDYDDYNFLP